jgi:hypothetical protein
VVLELGVLGDEVSRLDASLDAHLQAVASRMGFVPHIVPRNGFCCQESWSEWQDLNLRPPKSRTKHSTIVLGTATALKPLIGGAVSCFP